MRTIYSLIAVLILMLSANAAHAQCYESTCRTDDDGTVWCDNQEVPCDRITFQHESVVDLMNETAVETPLNTAYLAEPADGDVEASMNLVSPYNGYTTDSSQALDGNGNVCAIAYGLSLDDDTAQLYTPGYGQSEDEAPTATPAHDSYYGNHSDWYNLGNP